MSIYGTCPDCGDETRDYVCSSCHRREIEKLTEERDRLRELSECPPDCDLETWIKTLVDGWNFKCARRGALAQTKLSCGRYYLEVAGIVVAMQGDPCRGELPESVLPPIPPEELATATIGGEPTKEMPIEMVRFFRGDIWTTEMLEYAAAVINRRAAEPKGETDE